MNRDPGSEAAMARTVRVDIDGCAPLSDELLQALHAACDEVEDGGSPAVLRLCIRGGEPRTAWPGDVGVNEIHRWEKALRRLDLLDGVSVAVVSQACGAGAMELLMAADHRIADRTFSLEQLCAAGAGWPGMALHRVANRLGGAVGRRVSMFTTELKAPEALRLSLVDEVVDDAERAAEAFVAGLWGCDLGAMSARRLLVAESVGRDYQESLGTCLAACDVELRRRRAATGDGALSAEAPMAEGRLR